MKPLNKKSNEFYSNGIKKKLELKPLTQNNSKLLLEEGQQDRKEIREDCIRFKEYCDDLDCFLSSD